jgi:hypothetical protein
MASLNVILIRQGTEVEDGVSLFRNSINDSPEFGDVYYVPYTIEREAINA